jgi:hypothetical protein
MADRPGRHKKEKKKKFRFWKKVKKVKENVSGTPDSQESLSSQFYQRQSQDGGSRKNSPGSSGAKVTLLALSLDDSTETEGSSSRLSVERLSVESYLSHEGTSGSEIKAPGKPEVSEEKKARLNVSAQKAREKLRKRKDALARRSKKASEEPGKSYL